MISTAMREVEELFRAQRDGLWGLAYRLTGSGEDAEDIVQQAFVKLMAQPPDCPHDERGRWLVRVITNLGIDMLRRRRRRAYPGPWLPSASENPPAPSHDAEARYGLAESASYAFLVALEALSPRQRAVLLLRDVLGKSSEETAATLGASEGSVRALHLRARRALSDYEAARSIPTPELEERHRTVLQRFVQCLATGDPRGLEALLTADVRTTTDAGGEYTALKASLTGRARVARFYLQAAANRRDGGPRIDIRMVNGLPAALITLDHPVRRQAPRTLLMCELDEAGQIHRIHTILAPRKLAALGA